MPRPRFLAPALALFLLAPALRANDPIGRMERDLVFLAGEDCEGRGLKTQGIHKAAAYIAAEFQAAGLKPAFPDGYFQPFAVKESFLEAGPHKLALAGPDGKELDLTFGKTFTVSGLSGKGTVGGGLVFAGFGISSDKYDDYKDLDVTNKVVLVLRQNPRARAKKDVLFTEEETRKHAPLVEKIKLASKNKAAAIVFLNDKDMAGKDDPLMSFEYASEDGKVGTIPVVHAKRADIDRALAAAGKSLADLEAAIDKDLKPQSFTLAGWTAKVQTAVGVKEIPAKNVVGYLEGSGPLKDETVVLGAHYDHLGRGERGTKQPGTNAVHYGADDNGSGTTALMELARRYGARKDREGRRLVFVAFSGEERGLLGSLHYCDKPAFPLDKTVAMLNMDMVGRVRPDDKDHKDRLVVGGIGTAKSFEKLLDDANAQSGFHLSKDRSGVGPSDHTSFYLAKVPVYFFFTGEHAEYHTPKDRAETINFSGILKVADLVDRMATTIASAKERPEYVAGAGGSLGGKPGGPKLGVMPRYEESGDGMEISGVMPGGAAEAAGLKKGDKITAIAGKPVKNVQDYMAAMSGLKRGEDVELTVSRDGKTLKVKASPK